MPRNVTQVKLHSRLGTLDGHRDDDQIQSGSGFVFLGEKVALELLSECSFPDCTVPENGDFYS